jgi:alpha-ketoglutarate-dependent taurine dioxygenase
MQWAYVEGDDAIVPDIPDELKTAETGHEGDFMDKKQPLVKTAINGKDGLHFSPSQITGIVGKDEEEFVKLKKYIMQEYVTPKYIYDHVWQDGDILWMDQHVTIHRRIGTDGSESIPIEQLEKRLLHRIEVHDDYTLKKVTNTL